jgi:hypothetical protein
MVAKCCLSGDLPRLSSDILEQLLDLEELYTYLGIKLGGEPNDRPTKSGPGNIQNTNKETNIPSIVFILLLAGDTLTF